MRFDPVFIRRVCLLAAVFCCAPWSQAQTSQYQGVVDRMEYTTQTTQACPTLTPTQTVQGTMTQQPYTLFAANNVGCPAVTFTGSISLTRPAVTVTLSGTTASPIATPPSLVTSFTGSARVLSGLDEIHNFYVDLTVSGLASGETCNGGRPSRDESVTTLGNTIDMSADVRCAFPKLVVTPGSQVMSGTRVTEFRAEFLTRVILDSGHNGERCCTQRGGKFDVTFKTIYKFTSPTDTITISKATPSGSPFMKSEQRQALDAQIDYRLDSANKGKVRLEVIHQSDVSGARTSLNFVESAEFANGQQSIAISVAAFQVPSEGKIILKAELRDTTAATPRVAATSAEVTIKIADDYSIDHLEIVQVVQDAANSLPLVASKAAVIRVFVKRASSNGPQESVPVRVFITPPGGQARLLDRGVPAAVIKRQPGRRRTDSYNFFAAKDLFPEGDIVVRAVIDPDRTLSEYDTGNNELPLTRKFKRTRPLAVKYLAVCIEAPPQPRVCPSGAIANASGITQSLYPLARGDLSYARLDGPDLVWPERLDDEARRQKLFRQLERIYDDIVATGGIDFDQLTAWVAAGQLGDWGGEAAPQWLNAQGHVSISVDYPNNPNFSEFTLAHEIAHNLGLRHAVTPSCKAGTVNKAEDPNSDWPFKTSATTHEHGNNSATDRFKLGLPDDDPEVNYDIMSYCQPLWVSPFHYQQLYNSQALALNSSVTGVKGAATRFAAGDYALISGLVSRDGLSGELDPVFKQNGTAQLSVSDPAGDYCLVFLSPSGATLSQHCFRVNFVRAESGKEQASQIFSAIVSLPAAAARLSLRGLGRELTAITVSAQSPTVRIDAPAPGAQWPGGQDQVIRWTGSDPDGGSLTYSLHYSSGTGPWIPLAVDLTGTQFTLNPALIQGGSVRFRIRVSDGYNTSEAVVGPVNVVQSPAIAVNGAPLNLGEAVVGDSLVGVIPVNNTGSGPLIVSSVTSASAAFVVIGPELPMTIAAGSSAQVLLRYTPTALQTDLTNLTISSSATNQPKLVVAVQAAGTNGQTPRMQIDSPSLFFFNVALGAAQEINLAISNTSRVDLTVNWTLTAAAFQATGPQALTIQGGETQTIPVRFTPAALGAATATLTLRTNDPAQARVDIGLTGVGVSPPAPSQGPVFTAASIASAASFLPGRFAAEMWVALFGSNLADALVIAADSLPTSLGGTRVSVRDSAGVDRAAPLQFVSPSRLNFLMPSGTALGSAVVTVTNSRGESSSVTVPIERVAPGLFSADSSGRGPAAGTFLRVSANGTRSEGFTFTTDAARANVPLPIGPQGDQLFLSFFGTGFRAQESAGVRIGGVSVPIVGAVAQGQFQGLDQAVAGPLPRSLAGRGEVDVEFTFDGVKANTVTVNIQ